VIAVKIKKVFPSIIDLSAGDFQALGFLGKQLVPLQGIHHELDLENQAFKKI